MGLVCLIWSIKTEIGRFESEVCPLVPGSVRSVPAVGQFPIQAIEIFLRNFIGYTRYEKNHSLFLIIEIFFI